MFLFLKQRKLERRLHNNVYEESVTSSLIIQAIVLCMATLVIIDPSFISPNHLIKAAFVVLIYVEMKM